MAQHYTYIHQCNALPAIAAATATTAAVVLTDVKQAGSQ